MEKGDTNSEVKLPYSVPEIDIDHSYGIKDQDELERMRNTPVPGGGSQLEHLGANSQYPGDKAPQHISYIQNESYIHEDIERMRNTPVPGGGSQLEHLGESMPIPVSRGSFRNKLARFLKLKQANRHDIEGATKKAGNMLTRYENAGDNDRKDIQSQIVRHLDMETARLDNPAPVKVRK